MRTAVRVSLLAALTAGACVAASAQWVAQRSGVSVRLRGVSAVSARVAWASGDRGTYLRTTDGGATWRAGVVPGAEGLDFRDVDAFDADTAYLLSIGAGASSRIYKTTDGGAHWSLQFTNPHPEAFFDAMAFWDSRRGVAMSDPVRGRFLLVTTSDGGATWREVTPASIPAALAGEAAFAASGTCIAVGGHSDIWFGTGGGARARIFHSPDGGRTWSVADTPVRAGSASSGVFSVAFRDAREGFIVGGDYKQEAEGERNAALTRDGGRTWELIDKARPAGFRSAVAYVPGAGGARGRRGPFLLVAVGPSGTDYSDDGGRTWRGLGAEGFHSVGVARGALKGWAVGEQGRISRLDAAPLLRARRRTK